MFLDICKRHGLEIDEEPSYGGRQYLEKQDYIRMKQKEEIAVQQEMLNQQRDGLAAGKDYQFKGRYEAEKNAVIISLEKDEREC